MKFQMERSGILNCHWQSKIYNNGFVCSSNIEIVSKVKRSIRTESKVLEIILLIFLSSDEAKCHLVFSKVSDKFVFEKTECLVTCCMGNYFTAVRAVKFPHGQIVAFCSSLLDIS